MNFMVLFRHVYGTILQRIIFSVGQTFTQLTQDIEPMMVQRPRHCPSIGLMSTFTWVVICWWFIYTSQLVYVLYRVMHAEAR